MTTLVGIVLATLIVFVFRSVNAPSGNLFVGTLPEQLLLYGRLAGILTALLFLFLLLSNGRKRTLAFLFKPASLGKWHKWIGIGILVLLCVHAGLIFSGRALLYEDSFLTVAKHFFQPFFWGGLTGTGVLVLLAVAGLSMLFLARKIKFPFWRFTHYFTYLAVFLLFWHQIFCGWDFTGSVSFRIFWILLFVLTLADVVFWKIRSRKQE